MQKALWFALEATADQPEYAAEQAAQTARTVLQRYQEHNALLHRANASETAPDRHWYCMRFARCCRAFAAHLQCGKQGALLS